jgi:NAD(P)-dependent dehydrogenase (short-subunit alcohol dehydrogenase family)
MSTQSPVACVVGVGPGLGAAVARRFARGGHAVALLARGRDKLDPVEAELRAAGAQTLAVSADATDAACVAAAFDRVESELGPVEVLVYNAGAFRMGGVVELSPADFEAAWRANCMGGFLAAHRVAPGMIARRRGTLLFTGATASLRGSARFSALAVGKFGLRALAQSLARELGPQGIHVAHVVIDGQIDTPALRARDPGRAASTLLSPDALAETYWHLHGQDPTVWTQELDVRPATEKF